MELTKEQATKVFQEAVSQGKTDVANEMASYIKSFEGPAVDPNVMVESKAKRQDEMSGLDWLRETAKTGVTEGVAGLSALGQAAVLDPLSKMTGVELGRSAQTADMGFMESLGTTFQANQNTAQQLLQDYDVFDANKYTEQELRTADPTGGIATAGVRAASDPTSYIGAPIKAGQLGLRAFESMLGGAAADVGAQIGGEFSPEAALAGSVLLGGTATTLTAAPRQKALSVGAEKASQLYDKVTEINAARKVSAKDFEMSYAGRTARNLLKSVAEEAGADNIEQIVKDFDGIKDIVGVEQYPLIVALSENSALRSKFNEVARRSPELRAKVRSEMDLLVNAIENKSDELFGGRNLSIVGTQVNENLVKEAAKATQTVYDLDTKLAKVATRIEPTSKEALGNQIKGLIDAKSTAVRKSLGPEYQKVINAATQAGAALPADGTEAIYRFVVANNMRDIFGKTSEIDKKIMGYLKPKTVTKTVAPDPLAIRRTAQEVTEKVYRPITFDNVDSLKSEINRLQRTTKDATAQMKLRQLEEIVNTQRQKIPGDFNAQLQAVDKMYYERMGIPFDNNTIKDLSAKKYAEQVAPVLLRNPSAAKQFISTIGPESYPVLRNTVMSKLYETAVDATGKIKPNVLEANIKKYEEVIDLVPELRATLDDIVASNSSELRAYNAAVNQVSETKQAMEAAKVLADNPNLEITFKGVANNLGNPKEYQKFLKQVQLLDPKSKELITNRMRREVIAQAVAKDGGAVKYLTDPNNAPVLNSIMGNQYMKDLEAMGKLSDALAKTDVNKINVFPGKEELDEVQQRFGFSFPQFSSVMRDRIASFNQKVLILASKSNSSRMGAELDKKLMEVFLDPEGLNKLANIARTAEKQNYSVDVAKHVNDMRRVMSERVVGFNVSAIAREESRRKAEEEKVQTPIDMSNLGFGG
jgi:hypothetical protein